MKLIVESGATKTDFCLSDPDAPVCFRTSGINLATMDMDAVSRCVADAVSHFEGMSGTPVRTAVDEIHFYGAGLIGGSPVLEKLFLGFFPCAVFEAESDLMAAARALWGSEPGVAAIIGTGSNSCVYDGRSIVKNIRPCGYVLGDFGSGAALGRTFLADYLQGLMPQALSDDFRASYGVDYASAVASVYKGEAPARYMASFVPYIVSVARGNVPLDEDSRSYASFLIKDNFRTFIRRCLKQYDLSSYRTGAVGSFAYGCRDFMTEAAEEEGVAVTVFMPSPMEGLIKYHNDRNVQ